MEQVPYSNGSPTSASASNNMEGSPTHNGRDDFRDDKSKTTVYVGNLGSNVKERDLTDLCSLYGKVKNSTLKNGYAFVEFEDYGAATSAVSKLSTHILQGKKLVANFAKNQGWQRLPFPPTPVGTAGSSRQRYEGRPKMRYRQYSTSPLERSRSRSPRRGRSRSRTHSRSQSRSRSYSRSRSRSTSVSSSSSSSGSQKSRSPSSSPSPKRMKVEDKPNELNKAPLTPRKAEMSADGKIIEAIISKNPEVTLKQEKNLPPLTIPTTPTSNLNIPSVSTPTSLAPTGLHTVKEAHHKEVEGHHHHHRSDDAHRVHERDSKLTDMIAKLIEREDARDKEFRSMKEDFDLLRHQIQFLANEGLVNGPQQSMPQLSTLVTQTQQLMQQIPLIKQQMESIVKQEATVKILNQSFSSLEHRLFKYQDDMDKRLIGKEEQTAKQMENLTTEVTTSKEARYKKIEGLTTKVFNLEDKIEAYGVLLKKGMEEIQNLKEETSSQIQSILDILSDGAPPSKTNQKPKRAKKS